jgi:hypothetical protein
MDYSKGDICPYCQGKTAFVDSSYIYGISYGMVYICKPCKAYVGVHKGTSKALGRLANKELRNAKKDAHSVFDQLWAIKVSAGYSKSESRAKAYKWLSDEMGIPSEKTHIGMFDVEQCNKVVDLCKCVFAKVGI